jgi:hypothetical protein
MFRWVIPFLLLLVVAVSPAHADSLVVQTCGTNPQTYAPGATRLDTVDVNGNKCTTTSTGSAVTIANGGSVTLGNTADAAYTGSGSATVISILKGIYNGVTGAIAAGTNYIGQVGLNAVATGGWTPTSFVAANSNNATSLKASAGIVHAVEVYGVGAAPAYLKFYDQATSPSACGATNLVKSIMIPAAATAANGGGSNAIVMDAQFSTGIGYCVVTGIAVADNTSVAAATFLINIDWK